MLRKLLLIVAILFLTPIVALALLWPWLSQDEPLTPAAQAVLNYTPPAESALAGNGALTAWGFDAPPDADPSQLGRQRLAREIERRAINARAALRQAMPAPIGAGPQALQADDILPPALRCADPPKDCVAPVLAQPAPWQALVQKNAVALQRLSDLAQAPRYADVFPHYSGQAAQPWRVIARASELARIRIALSLAQGQPDAALAQLDTLLHAHQRLAEHSRRLSDSLTAAALLHQDLRWIHRLLHHAPELARHSARAQALQRSLARVRLPLGPALAYEAHALALSTYSLGQAGGADPATSGVTRAALDLLYTVLAHPGRTANALVLRAERLALLAQAPAHQMEQAWAQAQAQMAQDQAQRQSGLGWLRNTLGEVSLSTTQPNPVPDLQYAHDLEGHRRLLLLQLAALQADISPEHMPAWLAQQPPELRNPYTLAPMQWDAASASLVFEGRQPQPLQAAASSAYRLSLTPAP